MLLALALALTACTRAGHEERYAAPITAAPPEPSFEPLGGEWIHDVADAAGLAGVMTIPLGSREPRPLIVGVHAALGRPDWMCGAVRGSFDAELFVVCPHASSRLREASSWGSDAQLAAAVDRSVAAAIAAYGARIDTTRIVYFGHSQGGMLVPAVYARRAPAYPFTGLVLFEGMPKDTRALEGALHNMGVRQVLLVNGQGGWQAKHAALAASLTRHGFRAWHAPGAFGHFFNDAAIEILRRETPALLEPPTPL